LFVGGFDVDYGNLCAHGPEIGREEAAMVDGMAEAEAQVGDGGVIAQADPVHGSGKVVTGESGEAREALGEVILVPGGNFGAGFGGEERGGIVVFERVLDDGVEEPHLGAGDVPAELEGAHALGIGFVVAVVGRDGG